MPKITRKQSSRNKIVQIHQTNYTEKLNNIINNKEMKQRDYDWIIKKLDRKASVHKILNQMKKRLSDRKGPKRPKTAWQAYLEFFCKENPSKKRKENMKEAAEKWNQMSKDDRQVFITVSNEDKDRYAKEKFGN